MSFLKGVLFYVSLLVGEFLVCTSETPCIYIYIYIYCNNAC